MMIKVIIKIIEIFIEQIMMSNMTLYYDEMDSTLQFIHYLLNYMNDFDLIAIFGIFECLISIIAIMLWSMIISITKVISFIRITIIVIVVCVGVVTIAIVVIIVIASIIIIIIIVVIAIVVVVAVIIIVISKFIDIIVFITITII